MLHFGMNMPFYLMIIYGSIMILMVLLLRMLLRNRLPKFVFPVLWSVVLLRFVIPFSFSGPFSMPVPLNPVASYTTYGIVENAMMGTDSAIPEDGVLDTASTFVNTDVWEKDAHGRSDSVEQEVTVIENVAESGGSDAMFFADLPWRHVIPVVYLLGILAVAGILGWQKYICSKKLRGAFLIEHNETINSMLRSMDMGHVLVFSSDEIASPMVCGLLNPRIYLPTQMDFQNETLLRYIFAHETIHIRHRDNWQKCLMLIVLCLNWYNPLVWLMSQCLVSDMEASCDAAILRQYGEDAKKDYASSLLAMAVAGRRTALLYTAFSKTEVEKRVRNILHYRKTSFFVALLSALFMAGSMAAFAAVGQAPFLEDLTPFCSSANSKWGVRTTITRDIVLGENSQGRAERVIFSVLRTDDTGNPKIITDRIQTALAEEFGVEKKAFLVETYLYLSEEEVEKEYAGWGITKASDGHWFYKGKRVKVYEDKMLGSFQSWDKGVVEISVQRNDLGEITSITEWHQGN